MTARRAASSIWVTTSSAPELLDVVQHEERSSVSHLFEQTLRRSSSWEGEHVGDRRPHHVRARDHGQRYEEDPVGKGRGDPRGNLDRETGLARPSRSGQRDQTNVGRMDEAGQLRDGSFTPTRESSGSAGWTTPPET